MNNILHKSDRPSEVAQIAITWFPKVVYAQDPTRGGVNVAGLTGRLYLFGAKPGFPLVEDGELTIDLWDHTHVGKGGEPKLLEVLKIDPLTMKKLLSDDRIGKYYRLFFAWGTYSPDVTDLHIIARFQPKVGEAVTTQSKVTVDHENTAELRRMQISKPVNIERK